MSGSDLGVSILLIATDTGLFTPRRRPAISRSIGVRPSRPSIRKLSASASAIADADALIFLMDGREGLTPMDREIAGLLRGVNKPVSVAINKIDTPKSDPLISEFYELGWEPLYPLSAEHGAGVAELLDALYPLLPAATEGAANTDTPKVAVVGRPNVGKSTFINTLLGEPRLVVNEEPGTTPDAKAKYEAELRRRFAFVSWAPVLYGSALEFKTVAGVFPVINRALKAFGHRVPTAQLNRIFQDAIATHPLPIRKGKPVKSAYITQVAAKPPTFVLFCRHPEEIGAPYLRYLENHLRERFDFAGTPIRIFAKTK